MPRPMIEIADASVQQLPAGFAGATLPDVREVRLGTDSVAVDIIKSPLRYPGGKSRAVDMILGFLPRGIETLASPFFGGGSVELAAAAKGIRVFGYDLFKPLVLFWQHTLQKPGALANEVKKHYPLGRDEFYLLQKRMRDGQLSDWQLAALFYVLNRSSYSGITLSGGMSPGHPRFTESAIDRLRQFRISGLSVEIADFTDSLPKHENDFLYCDPPYANGEALYGQRGDCHVGFDHVELANILLKREGWILSYNDCAMIRSMYQGHAFHPVEWTYGMNNDKQSNEVLILSKDLEGATYG